MKSYLTKTLEALDIAAGKQSGVSPTAIYGSRKAQTEAGGAKPQANAGGVDWDEIADKQNAKAGLQRGPNPSSIYAQRKAQVETDR